MREFLCIKCSGTAIRLNYKKLVSWYRGNFDTDEFLACTCLKCGYTWTEKTSDNMGEKVICEN